MGARPDVEAPRELVQPADRAVRFQMRMLNAVRHIGALVNDGGLGKSRFDVADIAVNLADDVALRVVDARLRPLVVKDRRARTHCRVGIENGSKYFVVDDELTAARLGRGFAVGNYRGNALADKADHAVQKHGVVRIDAFVLVPRGRVEFCGRILVSQNRADARHR